ncbi:MAG: metallophosphoesterase family protein [Coriobacteriia bacterium]|nr:metallophosphoesterase family protein [Coriobacteriia bacterium]MBN2839712.1 metallophosphoesterase family protein [Coriobacteriia bacterium]
MQRIALYSDIHANIVALEAVIADMDAQGMAERYCLGDLAGYGPRPAEVIARVRELGDRVVQGNYDKAICEHHATPGTEFLTPQETLDGAESYAYAVGSVSPADAAFLRGLEPEILLDVEGARILLCHGSPRQVHDVIEADAEPALLAASIDEARADVVCCGHTHSPFHRVVVTADRFLHWVNAGSVGRPRDGDPRATWVELVIGKHEDVLSAASVDTACRRVGTTSMWLATIQHRVAYDVEAVVHDMSAAGLPPTLAAGLRIGLEEHDWEQALAARAAAHAAEAATQVDPAALELARQTCAHGDGICTCVIDDRIVSYEALARLFRGDISEVAVAMRRLRTSMRSCRVSRTVDEATVVATYAAADRSIRTQEGREAVVRERQRLYGEQKGFDPFANVLSPDESTYVSEDPRTCLEVLSQTYREGAFTAPAIGGVKRGPGDIATELSYVGHCLRMAAVGDAGAVVRARRFFIEHLAAWGVLFAVVVSREATDPVVRYAGLALDKFLTCEAATFRHAIPKACELDRTHP